MAVDYMAIRKVGGLGSAPAFSTMVQMRSENHYKLLRRLGLGDGAFPKGAKMRQ
jgi:hypothetical protein